MTNGGFDRMADTRTSRATLAGLLASIGHEWSMWRARHALAHLDEDALHDIGVGRSEIGTAVRHGRRSTGAA